MRRRAAILVGVALTGAVLAVTNLTTRAWGQRCPTESKFYGKTLTEWMQLYETWYIGGATGPDHVGPVKFLPLPNGDTVSGNFTYDDPGIVVGQIDVTLKPGTPFVLPVITWYGEAYEPALGYPNDPALPEDLFTDPHKSLIKVYIDGKRVMDSTVARVNPFYYGPAPINVVYPEPTSYGSIAAIFVQGIGFVHTPLSEGTHTISLVSGLQIPPDPANLNLNVNPEGVGVVYLNTWTIHVSHH
jgi:hypothetical protein